MSPALGFAFVPSIPIISGFKITGPPLFPGNTNASTIKLELEHNRKP
jgi:hypothetical protein